ncbi:RtcB family protein [Candidatus Microgenomates bacterium]|nr:RtcB family protein [Candidatus Microgenomates bacterium]
MERPGFKQISAVIWEIDKKFKKGMRVPARVIASKKLLEQMEDGVFEQITNVACLPGIQKYALALPDAHWGYGFPIGGVAAFDLDKGIISPGGIGFDINCGVRLILTNLQVDEVKPKTEILVNSLFNQVPTGVGCRSDLRLSKKELSEVMVKGPTWCVEKGFGWQEDLDHTEEKGKIAGVDLINVSQRAIERGLVQLGTLGSGNHYLEIQKVDQIFNSSLAKKWGIDNIGQITLMIHCGSRGLGHQVATDYLRICKKVMIKYGIAVLDNHLACVPFQSKEGQAYFSAMAGAANFAFANRQLIMDRVRKVFEKVFEKSAEDLGMKLVYDVAHNIAKIEKHKVNGQEKEVVVHRKGATRSFPGQPVIIGGSMETKSYLLVGTEKAMTEAFSSTSHGSGRVMSRKKAKKQVRGDQLAKDLKAKGIYVRTASFAGLAEEAGLAYKDVSEVVDSVDRAGISKKVASFVPIGNIKG